MSAIAGIVCLGQGQVDGEAAGRMARALAWRGPDDEGGYRAPGGRAALAARRRRPVDEAKGAGLPLANASRDIWLVLDGEVLNHRTLRHSLELLGHHFRSGSDAEVALEAYEQWDLGFVAHLQGAFAIALWDDRRDRLVLARDRLGRKPLYVARRRGWLGFASAIRPLVEEMDLPRHLDAGALAQYLSTGWVAPPATLVAGVGKLGPGEMLVVNRNGWPARWNWGSALPDSTRAAAIRSLSAERQADTLRTLFECSVADRMTGEGLPGVRLGASPAGGMVAATLSRLAGRAAPAVAVLSPDDPWRSRGIRALAGAAGCDLSEETVGETEAAAAMPSLAARLPEPVGDPAVLGGWLAARQAGAIGVTTLLSEEGAAELLLAHPAYQPLRRYARLWRLARLLPGRLGLGLLSGQSSRAAVAAALAAIPETTWPGLLGPAAVGRLPLPIPAARPVPGWMEGDPLATSGWLDLLGRGAECLALAADFAAQAHGLHSRLPFLDEGLVAYAQAIPGPARALPSGRLLRRIIGPLLPPSLAGLETRDPGLPVEDWLAGRLGDRLETSLAEGPLTRAGVLAADAVAALLAEHRRIGGQARSLWSLLILSEWCAALGIEGLASAASPDTVAATG